MRRCYDDAEDTLCQVFETKLKDQDKLESAAETQHCARAYEKLYSAEDGDGTESPLYDFDVVV